MNWQIPEKTAKRNEQTDSTKLFCLLNQLNNNKIKNKNKQKRKQKVERLLDRKESVKVRSFQLLE